MIIGRKAAAWIASIVAAAALASAATGQTGSDTSCAQPSDQQLRRFNEQCVGEILAFAEKLPKGTATIASEKDKYYVKLSRTGSGFQAESVSRQNFPYLKPETEQALKSLGWTPPDVEFGGFKRAFGDQDLKSGSAAQEIAKALTAFGMMPGEAISVTVSEAER